MPVNHIERLGQFARRVMLQRQKHHIGLRVEMADADRRKDVGDLFIDFPVAFGFPGRVDGGGKRVDKRMHIRGVHIVFFIPGGGRQNDI